MLIIAVAIGGGFSVGLGRTVCIATCGGNNGHPPRGDAPVVTGLQPSDSERGPSCCSFQIEYTVRGFRILRSALSVIRAHRSQVSLDVQYSSKKQ